MSELRAILFVLAAVCFIIGLRMLSSPRTARRGNAISAMGMGLAVLGAMAQILEESLREPGPWEIADLSPVLIGLFIGAAIGVPAARLIKMTAMPEMVALFNGSGGAASLLIGLAEHRRVFSDAEGVGGIALAESSAFALVTIGLAVLIGGVTFTGSVVAWGKLSEKLPGKPWLYTGQHFVNGALLLAAFAGVLGLAVAPQAAWVPWAVAVMALGLGVAVVAPIGGADMPVVIALLNSYSGLAACAAGFAVGNLLLIITGALVGASGLILTRIMCVAMNRSLGNVLFSGFGMAGGSESGGATGERLEARDVSPEEAYVMLEAASSVVFVPGYGMAVAQAQHAVRELATLLESNGAEVSFAIHPVAGRMPGHMSVLLAEAGVDYEQLAEIDDVNPGMENIDVAVVIGANDVVNPAAIEDETSPLKGMPIIEVHRARACLVLKRSLRSGYAGVENLLFFRSRTAMVFGDARKTLERIIVGFKEL